MQDHFPTGNSFRLFKILLLSTLSYSFLFETLPTEIILIATDFILPLITPVPIATSTSCHWYTHTQQSSTFFMHCFVVRYSVQNSSPKIASVCRSFFLYRCNQTRSPYTASVFRYSFLHHCSSLLLTSNYLYQHVILTTADALWTRLVPWTPRQMGANVFARLAIPKLVQGKLSYARVTSTILIINVLHVDYVACIDLV